jgi:predicted  nucleic acid-binding Zn-ribbon protein
MSVAFDALLHLQEHDTTIEQLEHKLATLPEREQLAANGRSLDALAAQTADVQGQRDAVAREQKRVEDEVATVEAKATEVNTKLYGGTVTSPKELQALQADFDSLKRRQRELEDHVIEAMEQAEPLDESLEALAAQRATLEAEGQAATVALAEREVEVSAELATAQDERAAIVPDVPEELLKAYDRLRPQYAGIAVARLVGNNCGGCHLTLSAMALDVIRKLPDDALATCDECGRILIR